LVLGLLLLGGCDFIFRLDEVPAPPGDDARRDSRGSNCTTADITFHPVNCGSVPFAGTPTELTEFAGHVAGDPTIRGDELEMFYVRGTTAGYQIAHAVRAASTSMFELVGDAEFSDPNAVETDPAINADGTYVAFVSTRGGGAAHVYLAHRECDTWETALAPGLESTVVMGVDLTWDALGLYYSVPGVGIYQVHRSSTAEPFGTPLLVLSSGLYPAISSDELELYVPNGGTYRATRTSVDAPFGVMSLALDSGGDPDVTVDGTGLLTARVGSSAQMLRRLCPDSR
jgi:hypothetical protein